MSHDLETMLDGLARANGSARTEPPEMFMRRVHRRRTVRRVTRAGVGVCAIALCAGAFFLNRSAVSPIEHSEPEVVYSAIDWPPLAAGGTGGPAEPIMAGIRPTDPMAVALLK
ncbi:MAG: hypothetical protein KF912_11835 [Phycisphaeraceae bacterium]|nr:hypothetical protein [Phycisphaeraceae bacterium]QYK48099.1 MAG: hypothetical protein KF838_15070 [Phycisphaeraceae bacterium]